MISDPYDDSVDPRLNKVGTNFPLSEQWRLAAQRWVDMESAANLLEECKTACFAQRVSTQQSTTVARAELAVRSSTEWVDYLDKMCVARANANLAKVEMEVIRMRFWEQNSSEANRRKEMGL